MGGGVTLALAHDQVEPHLAIFRGWNSLALWLSKAGVAGTRKPREGRQEHGLGVGLGAGIARNREQFSTHHFTPEAAPCLSNVMFLLPRQPR